MPRETKDDTERQRPSAEIPVVPEGYTAGIGPDGKKYIVPQFMVPALDQAFDSYRKQMDMKVFEESAQVSIALAHYS
jgi:hypothetical protein